jgi:hypothetical protein
MNKPAVRALFWTLLDVGITILLLVDSVGKADMAVVYVFLVALSTFFTIEEFMKLQDALR